MQMIRPLRWRIIGFSTACVRANAAVRLVASTASQSSRFMRSINWSLVMPALFTSTSRRPCRSSAPDTSRSIAPASETSTAAASAFPPAAAIASIASAALLPRAAPITVAPCAASFPAIARPMPREAPVTSATRPDKSIISFSGRARPRIPARLLAGPGMPRSALSQAALEGRQPVLVLDAVHGDAAIDLLDQAGEHRAGTQFDERPRAVRDEAFHHIFPANRRRYLPDERFDRLGGAALRLRIDVGDDGEGWIVRREGAQLGSETVLGGLHQGAMKRRGHRERHHA